MAEGGPERDIIVIGASAGGVETLIELCSRLPGNLKASIFIVLHTAPTGPGLLPTILQRYSNLTVLYPQNAERVEEGKIYVAPPNQHLLLPHGRMQLSSGPRENLLRPAADALFRSAAEAYGPRVVGVILTGTRNDGTIGLQLVKQAGGVAIVQDPEEAMFSAMPDSALHNLNVDYVLGVAGIAEKLVELSGTPAWNPDPEDLTAIRAQREALHLRKSVRDLFSGTESDPTKESSRRPRAGHSAPDKQDETRPDPEDRLEGPNSNGTASHFDLSERNLVHQGEVPMNEQEKPEQGMTPDPLVRKNEQQYENGGMPDGSTPLTCPECGGTLWELKEGALSLYVCHVGHRFSESSLLTGIGEMLEDALWTAVRALEERAFFCRRLANRSEAGGRRLAAQKFNKQADEATQKARLIRDIITSGKVTGSSEEPQEGIS